MGKSKIRELKVLCIGDLHFRTGHLSRGIEVIASILKIAEQTEPDLVVLLGDILHYHNIIQTKALKQAEELVEKLSENFPVEVIMGNHDFINPSQNQTQNHGFGAFKKWDNVEIIDRITLKIISGIEIILTPYLPYGVFISSLKKQLDDYTTADVIFAHQPFLSVDPKAEKYPSKAPRCYSGHIHDWVRIADNLIYTGSSVQVASNELPDKYAWLVTITKKDGELDFKEKRHRLEVRSTKTIGIAYEDLEAFDPGMAKHYHIKLIVRLTRKQKDEWLDSKIYQDLKKNPNLEIHPELIVKRTPKKSIKIKTPEAILQELLKDASKYANRAYQMIQD